MSKNRIKEMILATAKNVEDKESLLTGVLSKKLAKALEIYPHDKTIGTINRVMESIAENKGFISRKDFRQLYEKNYFVNTKFASIFAEELGNNTVKLATPTVMQHDSSKFEEYKGDQVLANALASAFEKGPLRVYSAEVAKQASNEIYNKLDLLHLKPSKISVDGGNEKFIVVRAEYITPKGPTSFFVPVEVFNNKICNAEVFVGNTGPLDLDHVNVKKYVTTFAGSKLKITAENVLSAITKFASTGEGLSQTEIAVIALNNDKQVQSEFFSSVIGQSIDKKASNEVSLPKLAEASTFEKELSSAVGAAEFVFGKNVVNAAKQQIANKLDSFGYNGQIKVVHANDNTIVFGVNVQNISFSVPVKVANKQIKNPGMIICNGSINEFTADVIDDMVLKNVTDLAVTAATSVYATAKPSDLINTIRTALAEKNYAKAEDALTVLSQSDDQKAYATALQVYMKGFGKQANEAPKCNHMLKSANSNQQICAHTGLPVSKTYVDNYGNCRPLYRRGMSETYEGASFNLSKILG